MIITVIILTLFLLLKADIYLVLLCAKSCVNGLYISLLTTLSGRVSPFTEEETGNSEKLSNLSQVAG